MMATRRVSELRVAGICHSRRDGADNYALLAPLSTDPHLLGVGDRVQEVVISNVCDALNGATRTAAVKAALVPTVGSLGLQTHPVKLGGPELADKQERRSSGAYYLRQLHHLGGDPAHLLDLVMMAVSAQRDRHAPSSGNPA